jgi:hypothetical protein
MSLFDGAASHLVAVARGLRRAFERDRLIANLKTLLTVAPLTVLVWIYAEEQQLVTEKDVPLRLAVQSLDPAHRAVTLLKPTDGTVQVTLQGSQSGIDRVKGLLEQTLLGEPLEVEVGNALPAGVEPLVTLDQIEGNKIFYEQGVTVISCAPETLTVRLDELAELPATVQAPPDAPGLVKAVFNPSTVSMRGPADLLAAMRRRGGLVAVVDLSDDPILKQPGEHPNYSVHFITQQNITCIPDTVTADLTIGQADQTLDVSPVPVKVESTKWLMDHYTFNFKEALTEPVTLVGPPQQLALVDPRNPKLIAVVELDNTDAGFGHGVKPVTFVDKGLPDGVRVKPDAPPRMIQIAIDPR